jgi:glycosyltransferase involved in cell wall biosynthesis
MIRFDGSSGRVAILLATKDGASFLDEQLLSYTSQTHSNWSLHVSDDGSLDATCDLVMKFAATRSQKVTLRAGPGRGFWQNFMSLAQDRGLEANYFAFSDQDDIWYPDKLERALNFLQQVQCDKPAVYCSRTELVDEQGRHIGFSPLFLKAPTFQNALVQNIGGGNTMVFNIAAKRLLEAADQVEIVSHDWWMYQAVSAAGGAVFYDPNPSVKYRQHSNNIVGSNAGYSARLARLRMVVGGRLAAWNETNVNALRSIRSLFHPSSVETFETFVAAREARGLADRLLLIRKAGVYRQTLFAQAGLLIAACLGKL